MSTPSSIPIQPNLITVGDSDYLSILTWPFSDQPFYEGQVKRILEVDFIRRNQESTVRIWIYRDPDGNVVGFGTIDVCSEYSRYSLGQRHCYIPVLAVHPGFQKRGHGRSIVQHLITESVAMVESEFDLSSLLFLDVYTANQGAIGLYQKCGFSILNPTALNIDRDENNEPYVVMAVTIRVDSQ